jgi:predicted PurR-regulated permease PerM
MPIKMTIDREAQFFTTPLRFSHSAITSQQYDSRYERRQSSMITIARITAIVLIILGMLVMLGGVAVGVTGAIHAGLRAANVSSVPMRAGGIGGVLLVVFIFVQGLMVTATGEGLYLLAQLAGKGPRIAASG